MRSPALPAPMREQAELRLEVARRIEALGEAWAAWCATGPDPAEIERMRMECGRRISDRVEDAR